MVTIYLCPRWKCWHQTIVVFERQVVENNATLWWGFKIEYFKVCISEFHFVDSILKESETNITDNWTGVREQCFNQKIDGLLLRKRKRSQYELKMLLLLQTPNARWVSIKIYRWGVFLSLYCIVVSKSIYLVLQKIASE